MEQKQTPNIFEDDLVCKGEDRSRVGEVIRLGWVKDDDNHDHDHEEGDECAGDDLEEHLVLVGWTSGELTKEDPKDLTVLERYVSLGDNVQRIPKDNNEQVVMGTVTGINMFLDVETKKGVLKNVHCENLKHVHPFQRDEFVITKKGKWIGRVFNTVCDVTILFEDGAACVIPEADSTVLKVIGQNQPQEEEQGEPSMAYQPGDLVRATKSILKEANWISGKNNPKRGMATVVDVQPSMIFVDWFSNADWEVKDDFPPGECTPKEIAMIDPFEKYNWGIGDICFLRKGLSEAKEVDQVLKADFEKAPIGTLKAKNNNKGASVKTFLQTSTGKIVSMLTYINVLWQDGTTSEKILSTSVFPVNETSEKDYFPHEYVHSQDSQDVGVVQKVNLGDLTCDVQWAPGSNIPKERLNESGVEVNVPVYSLREHPFNEFRLASAVIRLPAFKNNKNWCGFVTKTNGFKVEITWNTGEVSEEDPKTLMSLGVNDDDDDLMDGEDDFMGEENEDESRDDEEGGAHNQSDFVFNFGESKVVKPTKLESFTKVLEETDKLVVVLFGETWNMQCAQMMNSLDNFSNQFPDVTFVYVNVEEFKPTEANDSTSYPSFRVIHNKKVLSSLETSDENQLKSEVERWSQTVKSSSNTSATSSSTPNTSATPSESSSVTTTSTGTTLDPFFLVSGAPNKHCFLVQQPQSVDPKIVHKELGNLNSGLPKGCFVRAFDARLDILRVLVFGPENTPYTHTPFVFDVQLPLQYPTATPNIFFNSFVNEKMHPNLFVNGKVCSTLLGTYDDGIGELWGADSNLLTLCNHLQGSILNVAQPYFAEEDFEQLKGTKKGDFSSKVFSENALLLSVRNTISFLKNNHFEEFKDIVPHFLKSQKASILDNLRKYLGQDVKVDQPIYSVPFEGTSVAFKKVLAPLYEELANLL